jgi:uncharacterized membrane protein SirB2
VAFNAWGWGLLLIGWATLKTRALPRILGYVIFAYGIAAIIQFVFVVSLLQVGYRISGLLSLIVFVWLGVVLLREQEPSPAKALAAARVK